MYIYNYIIICNAWSYKYISSPHFKCGCSNLDLPSWPQIPWLQQCKMSQVHLRIWITTSFTWFILDLLKGFPPKKYNYIYIFTIDSPNGGFSVGKIKNHLKQTHVMSSSWFTSRNWAPGPLSGTSKWAMAQVPRLERFQTLPGRSQLVLSGHNSEVGFWRVHKSRWAMVIS